jgi:hypothetical protein
MKKLFILLTGLVLLTGCSGDDTTTSQRLEGNWAMTKYLTLTPTRPAIDGDAIAWSFNLQDGTVTVKDDAIDSYPYTIHPGTYKADITPAMITIHTAGYDREYKYSFNSNTLRICALDDSMPNAPVMLFSKN